MERLVKKRVWGTLQLAFNEIFSTLHLEKKNPKLGCVCVHACVCVCVCVKGQVSQYT